MKDDQIYGAILGGIVGDALGVPVEFSARAARISDPVDTMRGFGTHHQPLGTWSDDTSLTLCTMEAIVEEMGLTGMAKAFYRWMTEGHWTPHGRVFDIGGTTSRGIDFLYSNDFELLFPHYDIHSNGNGSLMRIMPAVLYSVAMSESDALQYIYRVSALTHGHHIALLSCGLYGLYTRQIAGHGDKHRAYGYLIKRLDKMRLEGGFEPYASEFKQLYNLQNAVAQDISSSGYVVDTLTASLWCVITTESFPEAVLKAVNLGGDTDTIGAVTGGLTGILYGVDDIPLDWINSLARLDDIKVLLNQFCSTITATTNPPEYVEGRVY